MILYCDTSALIKRYVNEGGTDIVQSLWAEHSHVATSSVAFAEGLAAFSRKRREGILTLEDYTETVRIFKSEFGSFIVIPLTAALNEMIEGLVHRHPLRGFDAIHLSSAITLSDSEAVAVRFACFDRTLNAAAQSEGLGIAMHE